MNVWSHVSFRVNSWTCYRTWPHYAIHVNTVWSMFNCWWKCWQRLHAQAVVPSLLNLFIFVSFDVDYKVDTYIAVVFKTAKVCFQSCMLVFVTFDSLIENIFNASPLQLIHSLTSTLGSAVLLISLIIHFVSYFSKRFMFCDMYILYVWNCWFSLFR